MDGFLGRPGGESPKSTRASSPYRLLSKSYPPVKQHSEQASSHNIKLTDLMDEDEARWMSNAESSRSPTPSQVVAGSQQTGQHKRSRVDYNSGYHCLEQQRAMSTHHNTGSQLAMETPSPIAEPMLGYARNMTPPLPPLPTGRHSPANKTHVRALSEPTTGLTALPHRSAAALPSSFAQRVFTAAKADLLYDYFERDRPWHIHKCKHGALDIVTLAKMQRHILQRKLVEQVRSIGERGCWMEIGVLDTIRQYCQINHDLEYMRQHDYRGSQSDPFIITTARPLEAKLLEDAGMARHDKHFDSHAPHLRLSRPSRASFSSHALRRLATVLLVASALVVPYLIALLAPTQLARIVTVCSCIFLFAVAATLLSLGRQPSVWPAALTLVYAAALIIFIGLNPSRYTTT